MKQDAPLTARLADALARADGPAQVLILVRLRKLDSIAQASGEEGVARVLAVAGERLRDLAGARAVVAELGDGIFGLMRPLGAERIEDVAQGVLAAISRPVLHEGAMLHVPGNAGACPVEPDVGDAGAHLERALRALERAMARGAGSVEVAAEARIDRAAADWEMRSLLEEATQRGELELEYQPIRSLADRRIARMEALLRWNSPHYGRVEPDRFIPMLEESGYIVQAGEWILERACRDLSHWRTRGGAPVSVAINVSPLQLRGDFEAHARRIVADSGCDPRWIELEITEGALIRDFVRVRERLDALVAMGFTLAIDDFGAGYSSLGQLAQLPVHQLKMDRSLLEGVPGSEKKVRIVRAVVALAEGLGLAVTAEGIESEAQAQWLGRFAGMQGQGYLFGRPMDAETAFKLLHAVDTR